MTTEEKQLQAELEDMRAMLARCEYLLSTNHNLDEHRLNEWATALCMWSRMISGLSLDLGEKPPTHH